jgi:hypothetical protein
MTNVQCVEPDPAEEAVRPCRTCKKPRPPQAFYENCSECKTCKRHRSRKNRALQARKIAAFERFVDVLFVLANRSDERPEPKEIAS